MALASSKNFGAPVDLVTTGDDKELREALSDESVFGHVNVVHMELCGENDAMPAFQCPGGFVDIIEQLKAAYVAAHPGESVAYFEADMVIQPGAGDVVRKALAENDFDVGYTYQPDFMTAFYDAHCGAACGSLNSGFILWKNVKTATNDWNSAVISALYGMGSSFNGGGDVSPYSRFFKRSFKPCELTDSICICMSRGLSHIIERGVRLTRVSLSGP